MDPVPFDYRLFDPPPKQHKQSSTSPHYEQQQQQYQQQQHHRQASSSAQNATNNTNMPGSISNKIRAKNSDSNANNDFKSNEFQQCASHSGGLNGTSLGMPVTHIAQSGSYVEILKQTQTQGHQQKLSILPTSICHNKSYGDFLTITPRRKGKLLSTNYADKHQRVSGILGDEEPKDNYRHHLPHSIEPLHLLGLPNDNISTFFDYRAMETLSNADTLAIGSTMAGHFYPKSKTYEPTISSLNANNYGTTTTSSAPTHTNMAVSDDFQQILGEKNLSPPSAFSDNITMSKT